MEMSSISPPQGDPCIPLGVLLVTSLSGAALTVFLQVHAINTRPENSQTCTKAHCAVGSTKVNPMLPFHSSSSLQPLVTSGELYSNSTVVALAECQERAKQGSAVAPVMATSVLDPSPNPTLPAAAQFSVMSPNQSECQR